MSNDPTLTEVKQMLAGMLNDPLHTRRPADWHKQLTSRIHEALESACCKYGCSERTISQVLIAFQNDNLIFSWWTSVLAPTPDGTFEINIQYSFQATYEKMFFYEKDFTPTLAMHP